MFVGYEIKAQQNQAKPVFLETDIKLSQAVLDPSKGGKKEPVCLMVEYDKKQFIIAVLDPTRSWQCPLDLMFSAGSQVKFFVKGNGTVHLTGFEYRDDMNSELTFDTSSEEEDGEEDDEEEPTESKATEKRASKIDAKKANTNGVNKGGKKDLKKPVGGDQADSDDDDESDDEDFDSEMMDDDDLDGSDEDDEELDDDLDLDEEDEESEGDEE